MDDLRYLSKNQIYYRQNRKHLLAKAKERYMLKGMGLLDQSTNKKKKEINSAPKEPIQVVTSNSSDIVVSFT